MGVRGSGSRGVGCDDYRPILNDSGYPLTAPFSSLSQESNVDMLTEHITKQGPILVTLFRDSILKSKVEELEELSGRMEKLRMNFFLQVSKIFGEAHSYQLLKWPEMYRSYHDNERSTHPLISNICRAAIIVSPVNIEVEDLVPFKNALVNAVHTEILSRSETRWTILGDETGDFTELQGKPSKYVSSGWKSAYVWVAVPPNSKLPPLDLYFHGGGSTSQEKREGKKMIIDAWKEMINENNVLLFSFPYEQGEVVSGQTPIATDPHFSPLQYTLPLVLEKISQQIEEETEVEIFVEQVGELESGQTIIEPIISELKNALVSRKNWEKISFCKPWIVSKKPLEHPWLGYPDALGDSVNDKKRRTVEEVNDMVKIRELTISIPYRQDSLNGCIKDALRKTARPLEFLTYLSSIPIVDLWDYVRVFLSEAIREATSSLRAHEWQDLNTHMRDTAGDEKGQKATQLILENCDCNSALEKMNSDKDRFELLMAMIGTANHKGDTETAEDVKDRIERLRDEGYEPGRDRLLKFHNLYAGTFDNIFDFDKSINSLDQYLPEELVMEPIQVEREEDARYLGSKIVALGLRNQTGDIEQAIDISEVVRDYPEGNYWHLRRHLIYLSELFLQQERYADAFEVLRERIEESCSFDRGENYGDGYYLAAMLKASYFSKQGVKEFEYAKTFVESRLKSDSEGCHPSQRIAYWFILWAGSLDKLEEANEAISHLTSIVAANEWNAHDVLGTMIACELLDLKHRGWIDFDAEAYLSKVLENSHESTRKWVSDHRPNDDDWLAPLSFNYR